MYIEKIEQQGDTINIYLDFKKGAKFEYNRKYYSAYDTVQRSQQHLNLFQYETYINARVARIKTDDGTKYPVPKALSKYEKKLKHAYKKFSSKEKGSKNWGKAKLEVARIHEKIKNTREDFLHKLTKSISIHWG